ncbi:hypothetical protein IU11_02935, partial [Cellulosimicrobium sp. MM]
MTVHPGTDVLLAAGTRLGDARPALADLGCRPELRTAPLAVDGVPVDDDQRCGTRPLLPGATVTVVRAGSDPRGRDDGPGPEGVLAAPRHVAVLGGPDAAARRRRARRPGTHPRGTVHDAGGGATAGTAWLVHDGAAHPACWAALLAVADWETTPAAGGAGTDPLDLAGGRALSVEQSNSSVLLPGVAGGTMLKVLRAIAIGPNPDVTIPRALAAQGWAGVPRPLAWLEVGWDATDDPAAPGHAPDPASPRS